MTSENTPRDEEAVLSMAVARLGGQVEGNPTGRHNFLQRIDALVKMEASVERLKGLPRWGDWRELEARADHLEQQLAEARRLLERIRAIFYNPRIHVSILDEISAFLSGRGDGT